MVGFVRRDNQVSMVNPKAMIFFGVSKGIARLFSATLVAGLSLVVLNGCASSQGAKGSRPAALPASPPAPPQKVQTMQELMVKLKEGFDEGRLDDPAFYEQELGYALERPGELRVMTPAGRSRTIRFDSGELKGKGAYVGPLLVKGDKSVVRIFFHEHLRTPCFTLNDMEAVWGVQQGKESWDSKGLSPLLNYTIEKHHGPLRSQVHYWIQREYPRCLSYFSASKQID